MIERTVIVSIAVGIELASESLGLSFSWCCWFLFSPIIFIPNVYSAPLVVLNPVSILSKSSGSFAIALDSPQMILSPTDSEVPDDQYPFSMLESAPEESPVGVGELHENLGHPCQARLSF